MKQCLEELSENHYIDCIKLLQNHCNNKFDPSAKSEFVLKMLPFSKCYRFQNIIIPLRLSDVHFGKSLFLMRNRIAGGVNYIRLFDIFEK